MQLMHVSFAATIIVMATHAASDLTIQETEVSETGSGHELRQFSHLDPGGKGFRGNVKKKTEQALHEIFSEIIDYKIMSYSE